MKISTWLRKKTDGLESARIDAIWEWYQSAAQFLFRCYRIPADGGFDLLDFGDRNFNHFINRIRE